VVCTLEAAVVELIVDNLVLRELVELVAVEQEEELLVHQLLELLTLAVVAVEKEQILYLAQGEQVDQE
tara:strand:+ start:576 stop:779 length:204 start_codon:yes stop_codon:yes gene_type:complete